MQTITRIGIIVLLGLIISVAAFNLGGNGGDRRGRGREDTVSTEATQDNHNDGHSHDDHEHGDDHEGRGGIIGGFVKTLAPLTTIVGLAALRLYYVDRKATPT